MMTDPGTGSSASYALLTDGSCVLIRAAEPGDWQAVHDFATALGRASVYRRFFGFPKYPGRLLADAVCAPAAPARVQARGALLAWLDGGVVGMAEWIRAADPAEAEIAFVVADRMQGRGVATLLAEHLLDEADRVGLQRFTAITQGENRAMLDVFATLGIPVRKTWEHGTWLVTADLDLPAAARVALLDAAARRERIADDASLRRLLEPGSVAVIGDQQDPATQAVREHLRGFAGHVWLSGPDAADIDPEARFELAVLTSPPEIAARAVRICGTHGARAVIATSTGFDDASGRALLDACRSAGMRLLGPGSLGVVNAGQRSGPLNASLAPGPFLRGSVGVAVQSGGVGLALLRHLERLGIGISTFAAVGDKYDVSANDLLMLWEGDERIRLGLLHVESFGNPRKFARTARRLSHRVPLLAVDPEQSPSEARTALYAQAGITAVPSMGALVCAAALLAHQPAPQGTRVAVLGNTRGMLSLAVQACIKAGLEVVAARNVTATADAERLRRAVSETVQSEPCDAVLIALAPTVPVAPHDAIAGGIVTGNIQVPVIAVLSEQAETVSVSSDDGMRSGSDAIPCYNDAAAAAAALVAAIAATAVRERSDDPEHDLDRIDRASARRVIESALVSTPHGRTLYASERAELLETFGIASSRGPVEGGDAGGSRRLTATAWQDPVFGPLLTCKRDVDGSGDVGMDAQSASGAMTLLVPAGAAELDEMTHVVLAEGRADPVVSQVLSGLLARIAALIDESPQLASLCVHLLVDASGSVRVIGSDGQVAPSQRKDPYLRRLRRAPVE